MVTGIRVAWRSAETSCGFPAAYGSTVRATTPEPSAWTEPASRAT